MRDDIDKIKKLAKWYYDRLDSPNNRPDGTEFYIFTGTGDDVSMVCAAISPNT